MYLKPFHDTWVKDLGTLKLLYYNTLVKIKLDPALDDKTGTMDSTQKDRTFLKKKDKPLDFNKILFRFKVCVSLCKLTALMHLYDHIEIAFFYGLMIQNIGKPSYGVMQ